MTGAYQFQARDVGFEHRRPVRWLWTSDESLPVDTVFAKRLSAMSINLMDQEAVKWPAIQKLLAPKRDGLHPDYELGFFERTLNEAFEVERSERLESGTRVLYYARPKR